MLGINNLDVDVDIEIGVDIEIEIDSESKEKIMKRNGQVVSKAAVKTGRAMARWAASGMNWGDGPHKAAVMAAGCAIIGGGAVALDRLGRKFLTAEAAAIAAGEAGDRNSGAPAACWWQTPASEIILASAA